MVEQLRVNHECAHRSWCYRPGGGQCQSYYNHLRGYLLVRLLSSIGSSCADLRSVETALPRVPDDCLRSVPAQPSVASPFLPSLPCHAIDHVVQSLWPPLELELRRRQRRGPSGGARPGAEAALGRSDCMLRLLKRLYTQHTPRRELMVAGLSSERISRRGRAASERDVQLEKVNFRVPLARAMARRRWIETEFHSQQVGRPTTR